MSLISISDLRKHPHSILISCEVLPRYLKNSHIFTIPTKVSELSSKVKKINLHQSLTIILYDKGTMYSASRLYCYLIAAGYKNVKVLYGGINSCEDDQNLLTEEEPTPVPLTERILLQLKENFLISKEDFIQMSISKLDSIYANFLYKHVFEFQHKLTAENITSFLSSCGIHLKLTKNCIFYGEVSSLLALFAHYLNFSSFLIVMDDFDTTTVFRTLHRSADTLYESLDSIVSKSYTSAELEHYMSPGLQVRSSSSNLKNKSCQASPCCGCSII